MKPRPVTIAMALGAAAAAAGQASFHPLEAPTPSWGQDALVVSADGRTVAGWRPTTVLLAARAFVWTEETGLQSIEPAAAPEPTRFIAISASGDRILAASGPDAFVWGRDTGYVPLPLLPGTSSNTPLLLSGDGTTVYGVCDALSHYRWTAAGGLEAFPAAPDERPLEKASGISDDGSRIVGAVLRRSPYRIWVVTPSGLEFLPDLGGPMGSLLVDSYGLQYPAEAGAVAADGSVIARSQAPGGRWTLARWSPAGNVAELEQEFWGVPRYVSADGGSFLTRESLQWSHHSQGSTTPIPPSAGGSGSFRARGISDDGAVVWGESSLGGVPSTPCIWTAARGSQSLASALAAAGAPTGGWTIHSVQAMSRDGTTFVGLARRLNPTQHMHYRAVLPR